ncbi:MAG: hypothetical protein NC237_13170, partial [Eubacterium sp.]|nr:hypothetical protein [Eubacterium sp.]
RRSRGRSVARRLRAEVRFSFPAVVSLLLCTDRAGTAVFCLLACMLHELGHILMMLAERKPPRKITFYGGGILLSAEGFESVRVLIGGVAANFLVFLISFFYGTWLGGSPRLLLFGAVNLLTGGLNLLPIRPLDGGRLVEKALLRLLPPESAMRAMRGVEIAVGALLIPSVIFFFARGMIGFSSVVFLIYLLAVDFLEKL